MIEIRTNCEHCNKPLPPNSAEAMICAFECTFCQECVESLLQNVCPNCGGGFERRPILRNEYLLKHPPLKEVIFKPVNQDEFQQKLQRFKDIKPSQR